MGDRATLARSNDFGVKTTSGLRISRCTCRRSRWKYWAAVEGTPPGCCPRHTGGGSAPCGPTSAPALPLVPVGEQHDQPGGLRPLSSPEATNWSMVIWAPLTKSPNCASHMTSASLCTTEYPYSKPPRRTPTAASRRRTSGPDPPTGRPAACTPRPSRSRRGRNGAGRTSPDGCPRRPAGCRCPRGASRRTTSPRPTPSRPRPPHTSCAVSRTASRAWDGG